jgi:acyl-coenzyme A thioesterase PaaI-like protein
VPDPFQNSSTSVVAGGSAFGDFLAAVREIQDLVAGTRPPPEVLEEMTRRLHSLAELLRPWIVEESRVLAGKRPDLPGRGHPLLLPFVVDHQTDQTVTGHVQFGRFYLGGNNAAHGGAIPLLFDEVLGRLSNAAGRSRARTAFLHVNYRSITPIGAELRVEARLDREEGRKRYISGKLLHGDEVVADATGLFVALRSGQP